MPDGLEGRAGVFERNPCPIQPGEHEYGDEMKNIPKGCFKQCYPDVQTFRTLRSLPQEGANPDALRVLQQVKHGIIRRLGMVVLIEDALTSIPRVQHTIGYRVFIGHLPHPKHNDIIIAHGDL